MRLNYARLRPIFDAFSDRRIIGEPVLFSDAVRDDVQARLLQADGVLVWVDPIDDEGDRSTLNTVLREVAARGVWASVHPDVIDKMGTKDVLYRTKNLGWGCDTHLYTTESEFRRSFPNQLRADRPRVLKQDRGNGGLGVWKVALLDAQSTTEPTAMSCVRVQHAALRDHVTEDVTLGAFMDRCSGYFTADGKLIDQPFVPRIIEGMIRAYVVQDAIVGFAHQQPASDAPPDRVLGMPSAKTMSDADDPTYARLRDLLEHDWIPGLCSLVDVERSELPLLWDADFLYGPPTQTGTDSYLLCEINVSSVLPFPSQTPQALAMAVRQRLITKSEPHG